MAGLKLNLDDANSYEMYVSDVGISGYLPWATWSEILLVIGGVAAGVAFAVWFSRYKKRMMATPKS